MKRGIVFDLTRMINYLDRAIPSGIERVDINYLNALLCSNEFDIKGIYELSLNGNLYFVRVPDFLVQLICDHLYDQWIKNKLEFEQFKLNALSIKGKIENTIKSVKFLPNIEVDRELIKIHRETLNPIYLNCTFINISNAQKHLYGIQSTGFITAYIIHDLIHIESPEFSYVNDNGRAHLERLQALFQMQANIISISNHTKSKIIEVANILNINSYSIFVNYSGTDKKFILQSRDLSRENMFVYVSTIEPRKNHLMLLQIWKRFINEMSSEDNIPKLVFIGRRGWGCQQVYDILDRNSAIRKYVVELSHASDDEMLNIIRRSKASLFPSFDEGWGLPVIESLAIGTPIICSDIEVLHESSGGCGYFIDPLDAISWKNTISAVSSGSLTLDIGNFKPIDWELSSQGLINILQSLK